MVENVTNIVNVATPSVEPIVRKPEPTNASVLGVPRLMASGECEYTHPLLRYFEFEHLPKPLRDVSVRFAQMADFIVSLPWSHGQRDVAMQRLLESKDAAVRAAMTPKGT